MKIIFLPRVVLICLLLSGICWCANAAGEKAPVNVIPAPDNCLAPDVAVDRDGVVHLVYGLAHDAFYMQSRDNGKSFSRPVKLNGNLGVTTTMGERGPKIALGKDGSIHVLWADQWSPGVQTYLRYSRSLDGGKTFETPKRIYDRPGCDGATIAADAAGHVMAFWHIMDTEKPPVPQATWLYFTSSNDNGATFSASERMKILHDLNGIACSMCAMRARFGPDGQVNLVFRNAQENIRDTYILKGSATENNFTAIRVNVDNWKIATCPMNGPELTVDPAGRMLCAFMSEHKVYWAIANKTMTQYALHVATPDNEQNEIYSSAYANRAGKVLFLWQVGPMSVSSTAVVKWALYTLDGKFTGEKGIIGTTFSGTRATAFVGTDDQFYIVTTAKPRG